MPNPFAQRVPTCCLAAKHLLLQVLTSRLLLRPHPQHFCRMWAHYKCNKGLILLQVTMEAEVVAVGVTLGAEVVAEETLVAVAVAVEVTLAAEVVAAEVTLAAEVVAVEVTLVAEVVSLEAEVVDVAAVAETLAVVAEEAVVVAEAVEEVPWCPKLPVQLCLSPMWPLQSQHASA